MTTQTTAEKLRILADAEEAREMVELKAPGEPLFTRSACQAVYYLDIGPPHTFARIQKPKEQIKVGERWINAPLRKMPEHKEKVWYTDVMGNVINTSWHNTVIDHKLLHNHNYWATEEDALAWQEASLALRKGGAV